MPVAQKVPLGCPKAGTVATLAGSWLLHVGVTAAVCRGNRPSARAGLCACHQVPWVAVAVRGMSALVAEMLTDLHRRACEGAV